MPESYQNNRMAPMRPIRKKGPIQSLYMTKQISNGIKLLIATPLYPPDIGGPATYAEALYRKLPEHNIDVTIVSFGEVRHLPKFIRHSIYFFKVYSAGKNVNIILAQDPVSVGLPAMLAAKLRGKRFLVRIAGDYAWEQGVQRFGITHTLETFSRRNREYPSSVQLLKFVQRWVTGRAEKTIVPSDYMKKIVSNWGVPRKNIVVIPNPVKDVSEQGNRRTLRGLLQIKGELIISVGRLVSWKGFLTLIDIMPELLKKLPNVKLFIVGSGPDLSELEKRAQRMGVDKQVIFAGALSRDILMRYLKASDVFVLNTSFESFSFQLVEAMFVGIPIVTTKIGSIPEIIKDGKNGLLVKPNDKKMLIKSIRRVLTDTGLSARLTRAARVTARNYHEDTVVPKIVKILM